MSRKINALTHTLTASTLATGDTLVGRDVSAGNPQGMDITAGEYREWALAFANVYHVEDYGAVGDGSTDDSAAIQGALDAAETAGGGTVLLGPKHYIIDADITIAGSVTLQGTFSTVPVVDVAGGNNDPGTTIYGSTIGITHDNGTSPTTAAAAMRATYNGAIQMQGRHSAVRGLIIWYPNQVTNTASSATPPTVYPATITMRAPSQLVENILFLNSYMAIECAYASLARIRHIQGQPLWKGIEFHHIIDIPRLEDIHFTPLWADGNNLNTWQRENGVAFSFYNVDNLMAHNLFCLDYNKGYLFGEDFDDTGTSASYAQEGAYGSMTNCGYDFMRLNGFDIDYLEPNTGLVVMNLFGQCDGGTSLSTHIEIDDTVDAPITFIGGTMWGDMVRAFGIRSAGTGDGLLLVQGFTFRGDYSTSHQVILVDTSDGRVMIKDNHFDPDNAVLYNVAATRAESLMVSGNEFYENTTGTDYDVYVNPGTAGAVQFAQVVNNVHHSARDLGHINITSNTTKALMAGNQRADGAITATNSATTATTANNA